MKRIKMLALTAICGLALVSCKQENAAAKIDEANISAAAERDANSGKFPVMTFDKVEHDFGTIKQGDQVETTFNFKNTGEKPLVIVGIKGSCGCTIPNDWPREAIAPGGEGKFSVKFNSRGKKNLAQQTVTITANTEKGRETVKIKAMVEVPEADVTLAKPVAKTPAVTK
ncbi:DUF1573 domain-containing protein [Pseudofulvibacter geojedonensis]|uniref:DUF1573 domain-containing protein n=1 Tax=Pseudofulvibacter geojedonensis TaxID=1123758 RepID=A0ABW3I2J0_9FLAO